MRVLKSSRAVPQDVTLHGQRVIADELSSLEWAITQDKCPYRTGNFVHEHVHKNST